MLERSIFLFGAFALPAACSILCLLVFLSLKREIERLRSRLARQDFSKRLDAMNARLESAEKRVDSAPRPLPVRHSMNLSRRTQVIRLAKRGEPAETIAATLGLPRREVELLLKVHRAAAPAAAAAGGVAGQPIA
jgi:hypothetical protein